MTPATTTKHDGAPSRRDGRGILDGCGDRRDPDRGGEGITLVTQPQVDVHSIDAAWRRAVMESSGDGVLILDGEGLVVDMNQTFVDMFGYRLEDGPYRPPYPWWPTEAEDAASLAEVREAYDRILLDQPVHIELVFYRHDRSRVWVRSGGARIDHTSIGTSHLRTMRDVTRDREARERRAAAAEVSRCFATVDDLGDLIGIAEHGFELLFDGECTIRLGDGAGRRWFGAADITTPDGLSEAVRVGLDGEPSPDTVTRRPGILLVPPTPDLDCRAWVQFPRPRRIAVEEMIAADLLASGLATALQRLSALEYAADQVSNLEVAVESHRLIGQATGILVERHRTVPSEAFERLRDASRRRNLKLRELATRVIETGLEPEDA